MMMIDEPLSGQMRRPPGKNGEVRSCLYCSMSASVDRFIGHSWLDQMVLMVPMVIAISCCSVGNLSENMALPSAL